ncbi:tetratricopeptide repeat protein [Vibrio parahaemolyticus]|uniref:tetratricopeptide repeat protein n=1 Tax=Vibrio parahaemolyticus TaxID=670 RepID=UPI0015DE5EC6|nr:tetratricopeptide repeat protein [Vibrio parahaemolyticus]MDF4646745.1 MSHA biogenesis protein MshN [Vibrio parahaemolyticus]MDF5419629.1 MSHA biogenesis protein MshN [Vibrio parahaemolyticus]MDF5445982.1 MSHA biogenesis protein MshN [Vibrio parahaemolyticus]HCE2431317.1 MSHA biogenesis protein MshN [Vibrio parahaemolyticus]HCE2488754.1 MSHA biogenesis protein MshN [Vibrio parahaemolyticus]
MSAINKALSELAEKTSPSELTRAEIPNVSRSKPWLWLVAGFLLSLAVGGWAVSQGPVPSDEITSFQPSATQPSDTTNADRLASSPTNKMTPETSNVVYSKPVEKPQAVAALPTPQPNEGVFGSRADADMSSDAPMLIAQVANAPSNTTTNLVEESSMRIEQVELSHRQLSLKAISRAEKAIDANDMETALSAYTEALRYEPSNIETRQKLAALYFGKGDTRKSYEILQEGINLDKDNQPLRLALSKLLVKANQPSAALSPLVHLPPMPSRDYLAMRAALAQKQKQNDIALESYQLLTQREPDNARWWLGLAIQQERALTFTAAINSYNEALGKVGISNQSQAFIRDRLTILKQLESAQ